MTEPEAVVEGWRQALLSMESLSDDITDASAKELEDALRASGASGKDPEGKPWPRNKDGGQPLKNIASAIRAVSYKKFIVVVLQFPYSMHHWGKAHNVKEKRVAIPTKTSKGWAVIMVQNGVKAFNERMRKAGR